MKMNSFGIVLTLSLLFVFLFNDVDAMKKKNPKTGVKNRIPKKMKPGKNDIVPDPGMFIPESLEQFVRLDTTKCDLSTTFELKGGKEYLLRNPGYPFFSAASSRCQWTFLVSPGVDVSITCSVFEVPCFYNAELFLQGSDGASGFVCSRSSGNRFSQSLRKLSSQYVLSMIFRSGFVRGVSRMSCTIKANGGTQQPTTTTAAPATTAAPGTTTTTAAATTKTTAKPTTMTTAAVKEECGRTAADGNKIVGGKETNIKNFPWQVFLILGSSACGGTVLDKCTILTAAHCTEGKSVRQVTAFLGCTDISNDGRNCDKKSISKIVNHPQYDFPINDIAILKLTDCIKAYTDNIRPICMPFPTPSLTPKTNLVPSTLVSTVGWGSTNDKGGETDILKEAVERVINDKTCSEAYSQQQAFPGIICTESVEGNTCGGDSGGFMGRRDTTANNRYVQYGLTSFGHIDGCESGKPSGYTEINDFKDFIVKNV